jgi:TonB family protein
MRIPMKIPFIARLAAAAAVLVVAQPARAQQDLRIGGFHLRLQTDPITDMDRSLALLYPRDHDREGTGLIMWACSGTTGDLMAGVKLGYGRTGATQPVVWRFDADRPDTTHLEGLDGTTWFLREADTAPFTIRAKTASRLVIRVPGGPPSFRTTDYFYDFRDAGNALNRLSCARNPSLLGRRVDEVEDTTPAPRVDAETGETYELSAVEEVPRPTNVADLRRALDANYPPLLRDARVTGTVEVRMRVMEDGTVDATSIQVTSSSHEQFNEPTIRAVRTLRFRPAKVNGRPVRVWVELPIQWTL